MAWGAWNTSLAQMRWRCAADDKLRAEDGAGVDTKCAMESSWVWQLSTLGSLVRGRCVRARRRCTGQLQCPLAMCKYSAMQLPAAMHDTVATARDCGWLVKAALACSVASIATGQCDRKSWSAGQR